METGQPSKQSASMASGPTSGQAGKPSAKALRSGATIEDAAGVFVLAGADLATVGRVKFVEGTYKGKKAYKFVLLAEDGWEYDGSTLVLAIVGREDNDEN